MRSGFLATQDVGGLTWFKQLAFGTFIADSTRSASLLAKRGRLRQLSMSPLETKSESEALLTRIARGDAEAVAECLERHAGIVWSIVSRAWKDYSTIEDLVQEIFVDVWKSASRFDPAKSSEATFIGTIARRRVIDRQRQMGRRPTLEPIEDHDVGAEDQGLSQVDIGDDSTIVHGALAELKPEQRQVIMMSVVDGLTHFDIATATGLPVGTVKSHIRRGLSKAADHLRSKQGGSSEV
jgi:RNA polymerase sigma factor (sigma-70 family)